MSMMSTAAANATDSTFSAGSSIKLSAKKFVSKLDFLDPNSKESVLKFIQIDSNNYFSASKKLQTNKEVLRLVCEIDSHIVDQLEGKAKKIAKKILQEDSMSYVPSWSCLGYVNIVVQD